MHRILSVIVVSLWFVCGAQAFQIDLPKGYVEKRDAKWRKEALTIWREVDRSEVEAIVREFVRQHPQIDGVDLMPTVGDLAWRFGDPRAISCGPWSVSLLAWESTYPKLSRIEWDHATMLISVAYDWKTKKLEGEATGEIRILVGLTRSGSIFEKKTIRVQFQAFDYGEVYIDLPFGGIELRKDGQPGATDNPDNAQRLREDH